MPGGELQRLIDVDETIAEPEVRRILRQVLEAVIFLHDRNIAHLDLKVSGGEMIHRAGQRGSIRYGAPAGAVYIFIRC